jgi:hypothetical protein
VASLAIILGAGFSRIAGVPLASGLFEDEPSVDRVSRERLVARVLRGWNSWRGVNGGAAEEYLSHLAQVDRGAYHDATWYVGLVIALKMGRLRRVGGQPTITAHHLALTTQDEDHERFWTTIFRVTHDVCVVTTNYDVLAERGLRHKPRPRVPRPGFHYGAGREVLAGGGYPSYAHIVKVSAEGTVPLLKLHGSISWSVRGGKLIKYHDCRPAIRGDAAIVAPIHEKTVPSFLEPTWQRAERELAASSTWLVVGYSLPAYDGEVRRLLRRAGQHRPRIHVFDPTADVATRYAAEVPGALVESHGRLPDALDDVAAVASQAADRRAQR